MEKSRFLAGITVLLCATLACNITVDTGGTATNTPLANVAPTATPSVEAPVASPSPAATTSPTMAVSPSPTIPLVSVTVATNCRAGPSTEFEILWALETNQKAEILGKNTELKYWIIKIPGGGQCWLWGQYAVVEGNVATLPEIPAPPLPATATPATPKPVTNLEFVGTCPGGIFLGGDLSWEDKSDNEDGFRVYAGNSLLATLGPNVESYHVTVVGPYGVESFNAAGASTRKTVPSSC